MPPCTRRRCGLAWTGATARETRMAIAEARMPILGEDDIVQSRQRAREAARQLGFGAVDQSRIATAVSELARNIVRYATDGRGQIMIRQLTSTDGRERT